MKELLRFDKVFSSISRGRNVAPAIYGHAEAYRRSSDSFRAVFEKKIGQFRTIAKSNCLSISSFFFASRYVSVLLRKKSENNPEATHIPPLRFGAGPVILPRIFRPVRIFKGKRVGTCF